MRNCAFVIFIGILVCFPARIFAQQRSASSALADSALSNPDALKMSCGFDLVLQELRKNVDFVAKEKMTNEAIAKKVLGGTANNGIDSVVLPVVVHIINTNPYAISDQVIYDAIKDLNDAYGKTGNYAASAGADTRIRFALAQKDPNGGNTKGINRVVSYYSDNMNMYNEDARLKNLHMWNPNKYINIWLVRNIVGEIGASFSCGVWTRMNAGGYSTMPATGTVGSSTDGIVVTGFGPMLAHEMGHYLGLYHTFEGGCTNNDCMSDGDKVCDTPPDGTTAGSPSCTNPTNSCKTDTLSNHSNGFFLTDTTDQIANFMDYGNSSCSNQFTQGQADRMWATLATLRTGLLPDVLVKPCNANVTASFTRNIPYPVVGDQIVFRNTSTGSTFFRWLVNDVSIATGPDTVKTIPATAVGKVKVTVFAYNADTSCYASFSDFVIVNCGVAARFYNDKRSIASKANIYLDTILFKNNSEGASIYQWVVSNSNGAGRNIVTSNAAGGGPNDLNYIFQQPGTYQVKLIARDTHGCVDSTSQVAIPVSDPTPDASMAITAVNCYQETKIRVQFYVCNNGFAPIPVNTPISFYDADPRVGPAKKLDSTFFMPDSLKGYCCGRVYTHILDVGYKRLNQVYGVVNDLGTTMPLHLPNATMPEKNYSNNVSVYKNFVFKVTTMPSVSTIAEPGDTLQLVAQTSPDASGSSTYTWSAPNRLSCTSCRSPYLYVDSTVTKTVIAKSQFQCYDTTAVEIQVPEANDYTVTVNSISCLPKSDSITVNFTVKNLFKRGVIPRGLQVSFYKNDPLTADAVLLRNVFTIADSAKMRQQSYRCNIKKIDGQTTLYASVNDNGTVVPVQAANAVFAEKLYTNNISSYLYQPMHNVIDTAICSGETFMGYSTSGTFIDNYLTKNGCDSQRIIHLTVRPVAITRTTINATICAGEKFAGYGVSGTYIDVYHGVNTCDSIRTLNLTVNPVVNKTYNVQICNGETYMAAGKLQSKTGKYTDTTRSYLGCDSVTTTYLVVNDLPSHFLPEDTMMCIGKTLPINLGSYPTIGWNTGSTSPVFTITSPGSYAVKVVDRNGCKGADSIHVLFQKCIPVQIPDAFTPNHDGKNDMFHPIIPVVLRNYKFQIFSRWGVLLFETTQYKAGWNGTYKGEPQSTGTYVYFLSFVDDDGFPVIKKGTFVLLK